MTRSVYIKIFSGFIAFLLLILGILAYLIIASESGSNSNQSDFNPIMLLPLFLTLLIGIFV